MTRRLPWRRLSPPPPPVPRPELWPRVRAVLEEWTDARPSEITPQVHLVEDLGMDSLDSVEVVMALEEEFGIEITDEEAEQLTTVPKLLQYLEEKLRHGERSDRG
ncbi:MAG: acyl carrier protein [Candidatus Omnitrophica bacterium]|nr:acyl carrier protein [Candidatus Omnitrophota bacterium]